MLFTEPYVALRGPFLVQTESCFQTSTKQVANLLLGSNDSGFNARKAWVAKVAENMTRTFIGSDHKLSCAAIVVAGAGDLKDDLVMSPLLDKRIKDAIIATVPVNYGGKNGFHEAISKCPQLATYEDSVEQGHLKEFFQTVAKTDELVLFGVSEVTAALETGAVQKILVTEDTKMCTVVVETSSSGNDETKSNQPCRRVENVAQAKVHSTVAAIRADLLANDSVRVFPFTRWLIEEAQRYDTQVEVISGGSALACQFANSFGVGGLLRFPIDRDALGTMDGDDDLEFEDSENEGNCSP
mmetsp:Transcript_5990/g.9265  ORF Transcript_5990/g.9265 Transcript_5990/m.9265 type:complete len:298 (-) Transcript_5990:214-1107(-)